MGRAQIQLKQQNKKILNYTKGILCEENSDRCPRQCKRESTQLGMMQAKTISEHAEETSWPNTGWMETSSLCSSLVHLCLSWVTLVKSPRLRQEVLLPPLLIGRERFSLHTENFSPESDEGSFNLQHQPFHKRRPWLSETRSSCGTHCTPRSSKKKRQMAPQDDPSVDFLCSLIYLKSRMQGAANAQSQKTDLQPVHFSLSITTGANLMWQKPVYRFWRQLS